MFVQSGTEKKVHSSIVGLAAKALTAGWLRPSTGRVSARVRPWVPHHLIVGATLAALSQKKVGLATAVLTAGVFFNEQVKWHAMWIIEMIWVIRHLSVVVMWHAHQLRVGTWESKISCHFFITSR
jgi:hypothetical protein